MKRWEFSIAVVIRGETETEAREKLRDVLMDRTLNDEQEEIADIILSVVNWDCEEYDEND